MSFHRWRDVSVQVAGDATTLEHPISLHVVTLRWTLMICIFSLLILLDLNVQMQRAAPSRRWDAPLVWNQVCFFDGFLEWISTDGLFQSGPGLDQWAEHFRTSINLQKNKTRSYVYWALKYEIIFHQLFSAKGFNISRNRSSNVKLKHGTDSNSHLNMIPDKW